MNDDEIIADIFQMNGGTDEEIRSLNLPKAIRLWSNLDQKHKKKGGDLRTRIPNISETGMDLIQKMLEYDRTKRINARQTLEHAYFRTENLPEIITDDPPEEKEEANEPPLEKEEEKIKRRKTGGCARSPKRQHGYNLRARPY